MFIDDVAPNEDFVFQPNHRFTSGDWVEKQNREGSNLFRYKHGTPN
jgi:hypothetical protein